MSESGFPQPPRPAGNTQNLPPAKADIQANVLTATGDLRSVDQPTRIQGDVIRVAKDGYVQIRTERGEVAVQTRGNKSQFQEGQRVEVNVPKGRPPRQVRVRAVPQQTPESSPPQTSQARNSSASDRSAPSPTAEQQQALPPDQRTSSEAQQTSRNTRTADNVERGDAHRQYHNANRNARQMNRSQC